MGTVKIATKTEAVTKTVHETRQSILSGQGTKTETATSDTASSATAPPTTLPRVAFVSFRLGGTDGVSIVARSWQRAFERLGWQSITVAGEGPVDRLVPGLEIEADMPADQREFELAVRDVDLVVVENLLTIPMNLRASAMVADSLRGRRAILHHHDPPWQRSRFVHVTELPATDPAWIHVTINKLTQAEFLSRGIRATTIYNGFDLDVPAGERLGTRSRLGLETQKLMVHPVRAIARKAIPEAIRLAEELEATYWLTGPAEEGYRPVLDRVLTQANCPVIHTPARCQADLYAAADLVLFPSLWEGFGNPPIEAAIYGTPVVVSHYPVADELRGLGFDWPDPNQVDILRQELDQPDDGRIEHNRTVIAQNLSSEHVRNRLDQLLKRAGWST